ncbi:MAG: ThuA domain-containing protein [Phycisphaerae bacterium]
MRTPTLLVTACAALLVLAAPAVTAAEPPLKCLIVDGQNNHNWKETTPIMKEILEETGLFTVDVATSPAKNEDMSGFTPEFAACDVVLLNYNGKAWPEETNQAFLDYVKGGGGVVVVHAADNAFGNWKEYNEIIGLGGWGGRNEKSGPYVYYKDGKLVRDTSPGRGGSHGPQYPVQIVVREPDHPVTKGLPATFMHSKEELYHSLRGPAKNLTVLATALAEKEKRGTGRHEPVLMDIRWGDGRIFHTVLGHAGTQMKSVAFIVTLQRGAEWAATGKVTQKVPDDFPTADEWKRRE